MINITFKGVSSADKGLRILSMTRRTTAAVNGESVTVSGRNGDLWLSQGTRMTYEYQMRASVKLSRLDEAAAFLTGSGRLIVSDRPDRGIDASIRSEVAFTRISNGADPLFQAEWSFTCQPGYAVLPEADDITITRSNSALTNPYTGESYPKVKVYGAGDITLNFGPTTIFFTGVETAIVIDSELLDAFTADEAQLANSQMDGDFPTINPGTQYISWTGAVSKVVITPRWRCI